MKEVFQKMKNGLKLMAVATLVSVGMLSGAHINAFAVNNQNTNTYSVGSYNNEIVNIPDANLRKALNTKYFNQAANAEITKNQMYRLKGTLYLGNAGIKDLTGLENAKGVTGLYLGYNSITDLSPIKSLKKLTSLNVVNQKINGGTVDASNVVANNIKDFDGKAIAPSKSKDYTYNKDNNTVTLKNGVKEYKYNTRVTFGSSRYTTYFSGTVSYN